MPVYEVTDSRTGRKFRLTGDSPPSESELHQIFSGVPSQSGTAPSFAQNLGYALNPLNLPEHLSRVLAEGANQPTRLVNAVAGTQIPDMFGADRPMLNLGAVRQYTDPSALLNLIPGFKENVQRGMSMLSPGLRKTAEVAQALPNAAAQGVEGLTTPGNVALLATGAELPAVAQRLMAALFGAQGALGVARDVPQVAQAVTDPTKSGADVAKAGGQTLADILMLAGGMHGMGPGMPTATPLGDAGRLTVADRLASGTMPVQFQDVKFEGRPFEERTVIGEQPQARRLTVPGQPPRFEPILFQGREAVGEPKQGGQISYAAPAASQAVPQARQELPLGGQVSSELSTSVRPTAEEAYGSRLGDLLNFIGTTRDREQLGQIVQEWQGQPYSDRQKMVLDFALQRRRALEGTPAKTQAASPLKMAEPEPTQEETLKAFESPKAVETAPVAAPQTTKLSPHDLEPALLVNDVPVKGGDTHTKIFEANRTNPDVVLAFADDAAHIFVDKTGKRYTRQEAATALGEKEPLHSERLNELKRAAKPPVVTAASKRAAAVEGGKGEGVPEHVTSATVQVLKTRQLSNEYPGQVADDLRLYSDFLKREGLDFYDPFSVTKYFADMTKRGLKPGSISRYKSALATAHDALLVTLGPESREVKALALSKSRQLGPRGGLSKTETTKALPPSTLTKVFQGLRKRIEGAGQGKVGQRVQDVDMARKQAVAVLAAYHLNARPSEILRLRVEDIDWAGKRITQTEWKGQRTRQVSDEVLAALKSVVGDKKTGLVFEGTTPGGRPSGQPLSRNTLNLTLSKIAKEEGLGSVSSYKYRATKATQLAASGATPEAIKSAMGHADLRSQAHYVDSARLADKEMGVDRTKELYDILFGEKKPETPIEERGAAGGNIGMNAMFDTANWKPVVRFGKAIASQVRDFAAWSKVMLAQYGRRVADHLQQLWDHIHSNEAGALFPRGDEGKLRIKPELASQFTIPKEDRLKGRPPRPVQDPNAPLIATKATQGIVKTINEAAQTRAGIEKPYKEQVKSLEDATKAGKTKSMEKALGVRVQPGERTTGRVIASKLSAELAKWQNAAAEVGRVITPIDVVAKVGDGEENGWLMRNVRKPLDRMANETLRLRDSLSKPLIDTARRLGLKNDDGEVIGVWAQLQQVDGEAKLKQSGITQETIDRVRKNGLSPAQQEWYDLARSVLDTMRPEVARVLKGVHGMKLLLEENYFPRQRDQERFVPDVRGENPVDVPGSKEATQDIVSEEVFNRRVTSASGERGFTVPRVLNSKQPIKINAFEVMERHIRDVANFVGMEEALHSKMNLIKSDAFEKAYGKVGQKFWMDWIDTVASQNRNSYRIAALDWFRNNSTPAVIGFRLGSMFVHTANVPLAILHTGGEQGLAAGSKYLYRGMVEAGTKEGQEFLHRWFAETYERGGGEPTITELTESGRTYKGKVTKAAFVIPRQIDQHLSQGMVLGAYMRLLEDKGKTFSFDGPIDHDAIDEARVLARRAVASPLPKDVPWVLSKGGSIGKTFFQFQNVFLDQWSNIRHELGRVGLQRLAEGDPKLAMRTLVALGGLLAIETGVKFGARATIQGLAGMEGREEDKGVKGLWRKFKDEAVKRVPGASLAMALWRSTDPDSPQPGTGVPALDVPFETVAKARQVGAAEGRRTPLVVTEAVGTAGELMGAPGSGQLMEYAGDVMRGHMQKATAKGIEETGERIYHRSGPYNLRERYAIAHAQREAEPPETVEQQTRRGLMSERAQGLRREELTRALPDDQQAWLKQRNLLLSGFKYTIEVGGESIQMTRDEQKFYHARLQEAVSEEVAREMTNTQFDRLPADLQKKRWSYIQARAHKKAELETAKAIQSGSTMEPNAAPRKYSAFRLNQ